MMSQNEDNRDIEIYKLVSEHYRQELREFWSRSSLYILSHAFLFGAFAALVSQSRVVNNKYLPMHLHDIWFEILVASVGVLLGVLGVSAVSASIRWIKKWRNQMLYLDTQDIDTFHSFSMVELTEVDPLSAVKHAKRELSKADSRWGVKFAEDDPQWAVEFAKEVLCNTDPEKLAELNKTDSQKALEGAKEVAKEVLCNTDLKAAARRSDEDNDIKAFLNNPVELTRWVPLFLFIIWGGILLVVVLTWFFPKVFDYVPK